MRLNALLRCFKGLFPAVPWSSITLNHHYLTEHRAPPSRYEVHVSQTQNINGELVAGNYLLVKVGEHKFALKSKAHPELGCDEYVCHTNIGGKYNVLSLGQPVQAQIKKARCWEIIQFNVRNKTWFALISFGMAAVGLHAWGELSGNCIAEIIVFACVILLTLVGLKQTR